LHKKEWRQDLDLKVHAISCHGNDDEACSTSCLIMQVSPKPPPPLATPLLEGNAIAKLNAILLMRGESCDSKTGARAELG